MRHITEFIHLVRAFGGIYGIGKEKSVAISANLSKERGHLPTQCIHMHLSVVAALNYQLFSNLPRNINQTLNIFLN